MSTTAKNEAHIQKEIKSGKYRDCYLVYNRKSTDDTDNQKNSIKYQRSENTRFAFREHLALAALTLDGFATDGVVSERHSGFKEDIELTFGHGNTAQYRVERPKFHRLVQMLSQGYFKGVIFLCWDRASRNKGDDTILRKLMKGAVDIRFTLAQYEKTSAGELHMDIDGMFAEHHSRVTREKVTITMRNKRAQGVCTYRATVGYLNEGIMEHKPFDPVRAPVVRKLFEMAATGDRSLADLARWAIEQGFTMPPVRRRRRYLSIAPILGWCLIMTAVGYEASAMSRSSLRHFSIRSRKHCEGRTRALTTSKLSIIRFAVWCVVRSVIASIPPYIKKGITYYTSRCRAGCTNGFNHVNFEFLAENIGSLIANLSFTDEELAEIDARASTDIALVDLRRTKQIEAGDHRKKRIREDLAYLSANRLPLLRSGAYTPESLVAEETRLNIELNSLNDAEAVSDISMAETVKDVVKLSELLKDAAPYYSNAKPHEKDAIIRVIVSELTVSENIFQYKCKNGFAALQSRFVALGGPIDWLFELVTQRDYIRQDGPLFGHFTLSLPSD